MADSPAETVDPISPALLELLAVFEGPLADVQFPGVDSSSLRARIDEVRSHALELDSLRARLDTLHAQLSEARTGLVRTAEQGLAYARVYAATNPELEARLAGITLTPGKPEPRRRKSDHAARQPAEASAGEQPRLPPRRGRKPRDVSDVSDTRDASDVVAES